MSKGSQLIKNTSIITIGKLCTQCISFLLLPLYTAILTTEEYGTVDLFIVYSTLALPIVTLALEQALFRFMLDERKNAIGKEEITSSVFFFSIAQSVAVTILVFAINLFLKNPYANNFALLVTASIWSNMMLQYSRGIGDNIGYALGSFFSASTQVLLNVVFLVGLHKGPEGMMLASIIGNALSAIVVVLRTKAFSFFKPTRISFAKIREMLRYSIPLIPNQLSWWALNTSDKIIINYFFGTAANGIIAISTKFSNVYIQFSNIFSVAWTESATLHIHDNDAEEFFTKAISSAIKIFASMCLGIITILPFVFNVLINTKYSESYNFIPIFMLASFFNTIVSLYGAIYVAHKKTKDISMTAVTATVINIISHLLLLSVVGLYAASLSTMIGYGSMALYRYYHSRRYLTVILPKKLLLHLLILWCVSFLSYYNTSTLFHIASLVFIVINCIVLNLNLIMTLLQSAKKIVKKARTKR